MQVLYNENRLSKVRERGSLISYYLLQVLVFPSMYVNLSFSHTLFNHTQLLQWDKEVEYCQFSDLLKYTKILVALPFLCIDILLVLLRLKDLLKVRKEINAGNWFCIYRVTSTTFEQDFSFPLIWRLIPSWEIPLYLHHMRVKIEALKHLLLIHSCDNRI